MSPITGFTDASRHLFSGRADLALTPASIDQSGLYGGALFQDRYVYLENVNNPLAMGDLTAEAFASAPHLVIHYGQIWLPVYHDALRKRGLDNLAHHLICATEPVSLTNLSCTIFDCCAVYPSHF